jgi:hypothetical protein
LGEEEEGEIERRREGSREEKKEVREKAEVRVSRPTNLDLETLRSKDEAEA